MEKKLTTKVLEAIRVDREEHGHTLTRIMERYRIGRATAHKAIEGLDASKVQRAPRPRIVPPFERPPRPPLSKANLGEASRQMIAARMLQAGLDVYLPIGEDTPVDLLVLRRDGIALKCQCKTMFVVEDGAHKMPLITVRKWGPSSKAAAHRYTRDEVDFFVGYAIDLDTVFVFPFDAVARFKNSLKIWLLRQPVGTNQHQRFDATPYRDAFQLLDIDFQNDG